MYPLTGNICIKMQERFIQKDQKWDHTGSIKRNDLLAYEKERLNYLFDTREISYNKQTRRLQEERKLFCKKSNGKSRHSSIHLRGDSSLSSAIKGWPEVNSHSEERNPDQKRLENDI